MPKYAVLIKTLYREAALKAAVESYERYLPSGDYRLYIADDGPPTDTTNQLYNRLRTDGHVVLQLPHDTGACAARNMLLDVLQDEKYVLRADDDFCLTSESKIPALAEVLHAERTLGAIAGVERQIGDGRGVRSGELSHRQGFMERKQQGQHLILRYHDLDEFRYREAGGVRYAFCDFTRNLLLIRREVFSAVRWDERLRFAHEHEDFLLALRQAGWRIAFSPDSIHEHREDLPSEWGDAYQRVKGRVSRRDESAVHGVFAVKWGVERISGRCSIRLGTRRHARRIRDSGLLGYLRDETARRVRTLKRRRLRAS